MSKRIERKYWSNGKLKYEISYQNNQQHGTSKGWYKNGKLYYEISYQNNQIHGIEKYWDENGKLVYKAYYLYGNEITKKEYLKHQMIIRLSCLKV